MSSVLPDGFVINGRYEVSGVLGKGGMGEVYLAVDQNTGNIPRAIKVIKDDLIDNDHALKRFVNEIQLLSQLNHPNVVGIIDSGKFLEQVERGGIIRRCDRYFFVMEYITGSDLTDLLPKALERGLRPNLELMKQVCLALDHIHRLTVHRDLKPSNIMVTDYGGQEYAKLVDFGIAQVKRDGGTVLTQHGALIGTVNWMSPEQLDPARRDADWVSPRLDMFAFGIVMFQALTGRHPFGHARDAFEMRRRILFDEPKSLAEFIPADKVPETLNEAMTRCLEKEPQNRPTALEVKALIDSSLEFVARGGRPPVRRRPAPPRASKPPSKPAAKPAAKKPAPAKGAGAGRPSPAAKARPKPAAAAPRAGQPSGSAQAAPAGAGAAARPSDVRPIRPALTTMGAAPAESQVDRVRRARDLFAKGSHAEAVRLAEPLLGDGVAQAVSCVGQAIEQEGSLAGISAIESSLSGASRRFPEQAELTDLCRAATARRRDLVREIASLGARSVILVAEAKRAADPADRARKAMRAWGTLKELQRRNDVTEADSTVLREARELADGTLSAALDSLSDSLGAIRDARRADSRSVEQALDRLAQVDVDIPSPPADSPLAGKGRQLRHSAASLKRDLTRDLVTWKQLEALRGRLDSLQRRKVAPDQMEQWSEAVEQIATHDERQRAAKASLLDQAAAAGTRRSPRR